jgi:AcrR family transcriptional regulator
METPKAGPEETRNKILEAAIDLFADKGFYATTTMKIAQKAGVNEVTLFRHFKNKNALFQEVLNEITRLGFDADTVKYFQIEPEDAIRLGVHTTFQLFEHNPRALRILVLSLLHGVEGFEENYVKNHKQVAIDFIAEAFRKLQEQGKITSKESPVILAHMLLSLTLEMAMQRVIVKSTPLNDYDRESLCESIIRLFMA